MSRNIEGGKVMSWMKASCNEAVVFYRWAGMVYSFQESESLGELSGGDLGWSPPLGGWLAASFL